MTMFSSLMTRKIKKEQNKKPFVIIGGFFVLGIFFIFLFIFYNFSGTILDERKNITIPKGFSVIQSADLLREEGIIRSSFWFRALSRVNNVSVKAGTYVFKETHSLPHVLQRLSDGDYGIDYISVTIPEGSTHRDIIEILESKEFFNDIDTKEIKKVPEGYLFPDTYSFSPFDSISFIIEIFEENFEKKYKKAAQDPSIHITKNEAVIMASIIEKEAANDLEQKQIISGILWKRFEKGMLLQVDAPFVYERQKGSAELTRTELEKDSLYNTYTRKGLTPTAIGNPGYDSLYAAFHPIASEYFFYLHGSDGNIYYAKNYDGHLKNIRMYLR